jgi:hypothetical protein
MNWQYLQLETIARQRYETLTREADQERLLAALRSEPKGGKRRLLFPTTYARRTTRWLRLALGSQKSEIRTQILTSDI